MNLKTHIRFNIFFVSREQLLNAFVFEVFFFQLLQLLVGALAIFIYIADDTIEIFRVGGVPFRNISAQRITVVSVFDVAGDVGRNGLSIFRFARI